MVAQDELVARIEAEARERQLSELKQYREDDTVTQTFEERIDDTVSQKIDSRSDEIVEWDDQPEPQPEPVLTPTKPKPSRNEQRSDAILAKTAGTPATTSFLLLSVGALDNFIHERFKKRMSDRYVSTYALAGHRCTQSEIDGV